MCGCESSHVVKDVSVCERIQILLVSIQLFLLQCVFKRKRKMNSPTNRNNIQQTIKDLVQKSQGQIEFSILNLKTRLSHVNFFIKGIVRVCGWFCTCPKYRHFFYLSEKSKVQLLVSNSERVLFD